MLIIPELRRFWKADHDFQSSLGYIVRPCLKKQNRKKRKPKFILEDLFNEIGFRGEKDMKWFLNS
jgi:hypothetical protein